MHGWAQLIFKISGCMWLVWGQVTLGSALVSKTKWESSCYFSPQFIFTITVKIIAVLEKVNSWVRHNQYINNIHHLRGMKPLLHSTFLRLHLGGKIENLHGKGSRKSAGVLMDKSSSAVCFLHQTPQKKVVITELYMGHLQSQASAASWGAETSFASPSWEIKAGSSD